VVFCFGGERGGAKGREAKGSEGKRGEEEEMEGKEKWGVGVPPPPPLPRRRIVTGPDLTWYTKDKAKEPN
jgi:hypothetical protein